MWFFLCQCNAALRRAKRYAPENRIWQRFLAGAARVVENSKRLTDAAHAVLTELGRHRARTEIRWRLPTHCRAFGWTAPIRASTPSLTSRRSFMPSPHICFLAVRIADA
jgi:hypothetical protein